MSGRNYLFCILPSQYTKSGMDEKSSILHVFFALTVKLRKLGNLTRQEYPPAALASEESVS